MLTVYSNYKDYKLTSRCLCYEYIKHASSHTFKTTKETFYPKTEMNCESSNIICIAICEKGNEEYIGEQENVKHVEVYCQHIWQPFYQQLKWKSRSALVEMRGGI